MKSEKEIAEIYSGWFRKMLDTGQNQNEFLPVLIRASRINFGIEEEWKAVKNYKGRYEVSNFGRVKSLERKINSSVQLCGYRVKREALLLLNVTRYGYSVVTLASEGKNKYARSHRLVAVAFVPNPENKATVNHENGIKIMNIVFNLTWATQGENNLHAFRVLGKKPVKGQLGKRGKLHKYSKPVLQLTMDMDIVAEFAAGREAARETGTHQASINRCCNGRSSFANGFKWMYKKDYYDNN